MKKSSTKRKTIHPILGDTTAQRKQHVCWLLKRLGIEIDRNQVRQHKGSVLKWNGWKQFLSKSLDGTFTFL